MMVVISEILCIDGVAPYSQVATQNFTLCNPCHGVTMQKALAVETPVEFKQQMKATEITGKDQVCLTDIWGTFSVSGFILPT